MNFKISWWLFHSYDNASKINSIISWWLLSIIESSDHSVNIVFESWPCRYWYFMVFLWLSGSFLVFFVIIIKNHYVIIIPIQGLWISWNNNPTLRGYILPCIDCTFHDHRHHKTDNDDIHVEQKFKKSGEKKWSFSRLDLKVA